MKANPILATVLILFVSLSVYAQSPSGLYTRKHHRSPEERAAKRAERKLRMMDMTHAERRTFKKALRKQRVARLSAMTPEKRARVIERHRQRREGR